MSVSKDTKPQRVSNKRTARALSPVSGVGDTMPSDAPEQVASAHPDERPSRDEIVPVSGDGARAAEMELREELEGLRKVQNDDQKDLSEFKTSLMDRIGELRDEVKEMRGELRAQTAKPTSGWVKSGVIAAMLLVMFMGFFIHRAVEHDAAEQKKEQRQAQQRGVERQPSSLLDRIPALIESASAQDSEAADAHQGSASAQVVSAAADLRHDH